MILLHTFMYLVHERTDLICVFMYNAVIYYFIYLMKLT